MKAFANIKSRYAEYKALDSADKVKAWKEGLINNAIYLLIIIAVIYTYTQNSRFLSVASIVNIISLSAANIPIACGIAGTIVLTGTDLSAGRVVGLTACISASLLQSVTYATKIFPDLPVLPIPLVILIVIVVGGIVGWVNGFFVAKFHLHPFIVTLATQIIFRGIAEVTLGAGGSIAITNTDGFRAIGGKVGNIPYILFLVLILGVLFAIFLGKSTFGRRTYAIGTNRVAAYYAGVHVEKIRFIIYTIMGLMSGLCALFLVSSSYGANTTTGNGFEMDAIAMAVFGGISSTGGKGNLAGGIISAFIIVCLRVGLGQRNVNAQVILLIIGVLLVAAVALPNIIGDVKKAVAMKKN